jgi:hypothetical protein
VGLSSGPSLGLKYLTAVKLRSHLKNEQTHGNSSLPQLAFSQRANKPRTLDTERKIVIGKVKKSCKMMKGKW